MVNNIHKEDMNKSFIVSFAVFVLGASLVCGCGNSRKTEAVADDSVQAFVTDSSATDSCVSDESISEESEVCESSADTGQAANKASVAPTGTYTFSDANGCCTFKLAINADKTCTLQRNGDDTIYYGSWSDYTNIDGTIGTFFNDGSPIIMWPDGDYRESNLVIKDGYIYGGSTASDAKNPRKRLPCSK